MKRAATILAGMVLMVAVVVPLRGAGLKQELSPWLILGPLPVTEAEFEAHKTDEALVSFSHLDASRAIPRMGDEVEWGKNTRFQWRQYRDENLAVSSPGVYYMATWLNTSRWLAARLLLDRVDYAFTVYLDGEARETSRVHADRWGVDMHLPTGSHKLVIKLLVRPKRIPRFLPFLEWSDEFGTIPLRVSMEPGAEMGIEHVLHAADAASVKMAPDGRHVAVTFRQLSAGDLRRSWTEVLEVDSGRVVWTSEGLGEVSGLTWLPDSAAFAFIRKYKEKADIVVHRLKDHALHTVCPAVARLESIRWSPDNRYLVYTAAEPTPEQAEWKHVQEIADRAGSPPKRVGLFIHYTAGSITRCLAAPEERFYSALISPDGKCILLERKIPDLSGRPYERYEGILIDAATMERKPLLADPWINEVSWAPDSGRLLVIGGASAFDGAGNVLSAGEIPNDFDGQAFLFDIATRAVTPISRSFAPSITTGFWHSRNQGIYFHVVDGARESLATWRKDRGFELLDFPVDVVHRVDWSREQPLAVAWASGVTTPHRLYRVDLKRKRVNVLRDVNAGLFQQIRFGKVEDLNYRTADGRMVPGRLYYPPKFNPNHRYPLIVYYYGGTTPVSRDFGGRYPKNWYAAQGYMVYVLQPTGTVGYGSSAAAVHVNDWGKHTAAEVVAAVEALTRSHPNVDPQRVGGMGASYGGFLTQYLAATSKNFVALISHAGISSLSSYWGVGDWGVSYSGVASADSFPWNRKSLYVDQSPLFMADRIHTPLLLLHGEQDNNVPPGESYQMFAALKLLGREVALVTFKDQQHFILEPPQRRRWMRTIIAWFDYWLKNQPQAWKEMYPKAE